ncbi:uncharacterized protein K460DRAFT_346043 [Cucurbitaria berberidis CBS 394.84]|uniref:Uncharacterized protein n=1 Tax=Cucurbitaria berberidis CBS 394.84 TaxID=1168544 RepID=A0A9P4L5H8_9PLEO|nr:uncharacterized protein K460DRAFT_346043 [Cucurbitaria berberidis CBS 394.84]KAF1842329.1 hypothetical protein K460DRAFT_346043 [Cucurbitaria berberidis CBS 394.84]
MPVPGPNAVLKSRLQSSKANPPPSQPQSDPAVRDVKPEEASRDVAHSILRPSIARPPSFQSDVEGAKRRSLLPQLGQPRYNPRSDVPSDVSNRNNDAKEADLGVTGSVGQPGNVSVTKEANVHSATPGRIRPRSLYQTGTAPSERAMYSNDPTASKVMPPPASVSKPSEPQTTVLSRSQTLRKPGAVMQSAQPTRTAVHSRAQSVSTAAAARRDAVKSNTGSERPKSLLVAPSSNIKTNDVPKDKALNGTRATRIAHTRSASTRVKSEALSGSANAVTAIRPAEPVISQSRHREPVREEPKKIARPAFSTLQQHFTPRKTGKAPTATFLHPAPAPSTNALPPEIVNLQSELLQLHLLHEASAHVSSCWETSAKRNLHKKFEEVASLYQAMLEFERAGQEQKNLQSLLEWSAGKSTAGLVEYIQILSGPLHELPALVESGGRIHRLVSEFEHWVSWVQEARSARRGSTEDKGTLGVIDGLGDAWKAETTGLIRKVTSFARDLERIDQPLSGSSIACIVEACKSLLEGILDELHAMQAIEAEVVAKEKDWIEDRLRVIARDIGSSYLVETSAESLAWRM